MMESVEVSRLCEAIDKIAKAISPGSTIYKSEISLAEVAKLAASNLGRIADAINKYVAYLEKKDDAE